MSRVAWLGVAVLVASSVAAPARAEPAPARGVWLIDRAVARFHAPETGGVKAPQFVYERVLAFEARLQALADPERDPLTPYRERHITAALEQHVAETLLAALRIDPEPTEADVARQIQSARVRLLERIGGEQALSDAARDEGLGARDVLAILRRQANASLYLDRMVAPMLDPSEAELETLHRTRRTPFRDLPLQQVKPGLRRWYVGQRLAAALASFYQNARGRLTLTLLGDLPGMRRPRP